MLLDELGAGTDPQEGAALARAILAHLLERRIPTLVATHYPELKAFAHATPGVVNASVEFDLKTLRPTYHLTIGLPGRSNALAIAERLGLSKEIVNRRADARPDRPARRRPARTRSTTSATSRARRAARRPRQVRGEKRARAGAAAGKDRRRAPGDPGEGPPGGKRSRKPGCRARVHVRRWPAPASRWKRSSRSGAGGRARARTSSSRSSAAPSERPPRTLGEKVRLRSLHMDGVVSALGEEDLEVQLGNLRVRARLGDLLRAGRLSR